jgi:hypothetical protein
MSEKAKVDEGQLLKPYEISRETLKNLITAAEAGSARLVDWEIYGVPAISGLAAEVEVPVAQAGEFVQQVMALPHFRPRLCGQVFGIIKIDCLRFKITAGQPS